MEKDERDDVRWAKRKAEKPMKSGCGERLKRRWKVGVKKIEKTMESRRGEQLKGRRRVGVEKGRKDDEECVWRKVETTMEESACGERLKRRWKAGVEKD